MSEIDIKSIDELLKENFFIPSYQRGYRWNVRQAEDLLDDIWTFIMSDPKKDDWYCLQPVVVKNSKDSADAWEVVDGQQRLTTIFLILKYLEKVVDSERKSFDIEYKTRKKSKIFLHNVNEEESETNIDFKHIYLVSKSVEKWFVNKAQKHSSVRSAFITPFLQKVKVIWYKTDDSPDGSVIFSRINKGKIDLTSAELIKALFLNSSNFKKDNDSSGERIRLKQIEIASEWDQIEYALRNDEFWLFINKEENEKETRIDFIFELLTGKPDDPDDTLFTFREYFKKFPENTEEVIVKNWKEVKRHFQILNDWFEDRVLYHKIGFLITTDNSDEGVIGGLIKHSSVLEKDAFLKLIDSMIIEKFKNVNIDEMVYGNRLIKDILLLHNIQTMLNNEKEKSRFPFDRYKNKKEKWHEEHVHAVASEMPESDQHKTDWLLQSREYINEKEEKGKNLITQIDSYKKENRESFETLFNDILKYFSENGIHEDINDISNIVLLDAETNMSYKNAVFPVKRKTIVKREKDGTFVPVCTKNVFMKCYSEKIEQMTFWGETDRISYFNNIKEVLKDYLPAHDSGDNNE